MNRLFEILYLLLDKKKITAEELSAHFEVSVRTIYRDIETLSLAGIPVYTSQGRNGGISLLDNYVIDRLLLSNQDQRQILSALQSMQEVDKNEITPVLSKLNTLFRTNSQSWVSIDFSNWNGRRSEILLTIKTGILCRQLIQFDYYNSQGIKSERTAKPIQLWFKCHSWYLRAYCQTKNAFRVFKLLRMKNVRLTNEYFEEHPLNYLIDESSTDSSNIRCLDFKMWVERTAAYRVYEDFEEDEFFINEDGSFTVSMSCPEDRWLYGYILSYGIYAKVIEPEYLREKIKAFAKEMYENYNNP